MRLHKFARVTKLQRALIVVVAHRKSATVRMRFGEQGLVNRYIDRRHTDAPLSQLVEDDFPFAKKYILANRGTVDL